MSEENYLTISRDFEGALVHVTLDRPKGNVFTIEVMKQLRAAIEDAQSEADCKCIALHAVGKHFSFGAEVAEHKREVIGDALQVLHGLIMTIAASPVPVAAVVQGMCLGGAFEVVSACHFIFASDTASFGLPEIVLGVFPPAGSVILPLKLGQALCDQIVLTGDTLPAKVLRRSGFVNQILPNGTLAPWVLEWFAGSLGKHSAASIRQATRASRTIFVAQLEQYLRSVEVQYTDELMETHDANEGIAAFLEKRQPVWTNA